MQEGLLHLLDVTGSTLAQLQHENAQLRLALTEALKPDADLNLADLDLGPLQEVDSGDDPTNPSPV